MYDELVKRLRNRRICIQQLGTLNDYPLLGEAADAIEELQAAEKKYLANISALETENQHLKRERDWIPVTERLPEERQFVLAWKDEKPNGFACVSFWMDNAGWAFKNITHWMPLPQPPKEE